MVWYTISLPQRAAASLLILLALAKLIERSVFWAQFQLLCKKLLIKSTEKSFTSGYTLGCSGQQSLLRSYAHLMQNYKNAYLPQWPKGLRNSIFIFGIEPYAQILTLAAYVASQFVFQFIYTDGLGTGNYLCALGMPGFRGLTVLKRLLTGCLAWHFKCLWAPLGSRSVEGTERQFELSPVLRDEARKQEQPWCC